MGGFWGGRGLGCGGLIFSWPARLAPGRLLVCGNLGVAVGGVGIVVLFAGDAEDGAVGVSFGVG